LGKHDEFLPLGPVAQREKAFHQPERVDRDLVGFYFRGARRHRDDIHRWHSGVKVVTQASLETIIERLQSCIIDARWLQLKMLEQILSMAELQAREDRQAFEHDKEDSHS
jgi:hypothetical protein